MKIQIGLLPFIICNSATPLGNNARNNSILTPFAFVPPALEKPVSLPAPPRPYKNNLTPDETAAISVNIAGQLDEAQEEMEAAVGGKPSVEQPEAEKEEKARSKGNFLTKIMEDASKIFSVIHFWYKWGTPECANGQLPGSSDD